MAARTDAEQTPKPEPSATNMPDQASVKGVPWSRWVLFWSLALGGAAFDLTTKAVVFNRVGPPGSPAVEIIPGVLDLRTSFNAGALWGFGGSWEYSSLVFALLSVVAAVFICYWLFVLGHAIDRLQTTTLGLIMAGALGNCYDRLRFGHVRDFMHVHVDSIGFDFPIFNFADNMLVVGAVGLMLLALRPEPAEHPGPGQAGQTESVISR